MIILIRYSLLEMIKGSRLAHLWSLFLKVGNTKRDTVNKLNKVFNNLRYQIHTYFPVLKIETDA